MTIKEKMWVIYKDHTIGMFKSNAHMINHYVNFKKNLIKNNIY